MNRTLLLSLCVASAVTLQGRAQMLVHTSYDGGGLSIAGLGDLNGDGHADFVVPVQPGLSALSGIDRSVIWHIPVGAPDEASLFYTLANAGDVDADGTDDLIVGNRLDGWVRVYSAVSQAVLYEWQQPLPAFAFGSSVASAGDIDGDGHADLIVGAVDTDPAVGRAYVYSGATGNLVYALSPSLPQEDFARLVGTAGDIDADGFDDFMVSAPGIGGPWYASGHVYIYSGISGALLRDLAAPPAGLGFGMSFCALGDVDQDGYDDVMIGAPHENRWIVPAVPPGKVTVFSGRTGNEIYSVLGHSPVLSNFFGWLLAALDDIDGDGVSDVVVGTAHLASIVDHFDILSGRTGASIAADCFHFGRAVAIADVGDINADGIADIGINGHAIHGPDTYALYLSTWPAPTNYCTAKVNSAGCTPLLQSSPGRASRSVTSSSSTPI